jgi:hypothetical protein
MIPITDFPDATSPYWEVLDSTGKLEKDNLEYDPDYESGFVRRYVLQQIINNYSIMSGCKNQEWKIIGSVFTLS